MTFNMLRLCMILVSGVGNLVRSAGFNKSALATGIRVIVSLTVTIQGFRFKVLLSSMEAYRGSISTGRSLCRTSFRVHARFEKAVFSPPKGAYMASMGVLGGSGRLSK